METEKITRDRTWTRILIYILITFVLTWAFEFTVVYKLVGDEEWTMELFRGLMKGAKETEIAMVAKTIATYSMSIAMLMPAIGVLLTRLFTREGFKNSMLRFHFKGNWGVYILAWIGPFVLTVLGSVIYFLLFPGKFDPSLSSMVESYAAQGVTVDPVQLKSTLAWQLPLTLVIAPLANAVFCFGEEWGWRGYMFPKMLQKMKLVPALLLSCVIWGVWHAPLTAIGHNYGMGYNGFPYTGIAMMCVFCLAIGVLFSYASNKANSVWPAVIGHSMINGIAAIGTYFCLGGGDPFVGPSPTGIIGASAFIVTDVILIVIWAKRRRKERAIAAENAA